MEDSFFTFDQEDAKALEKVLLPMIPVINRHLREEVSQQTGVTVVAYNDVSELCYHMLAGTHEEFGDMVRREAHEECARLEPFRQFQTSRALYVDPKRMPEARAIRVGYWRFGASGLNTGYNSDAGRNEPNVNEAVILYGLGVIKKISKAKVEEIMLSAHGMFDLYIWLSVLQGELNPL